MLLGFSRSVPLYVMVGGNCECRLLPRPGGLTVTLAAAVTIVLGPEWRKANAEGKSALIL